jgi:bacterioferritin-associated ferredoxin
VANGEGLTMIVCHCRAVSDKRVRSELANGAQDEIDVAMACGAGTGCGSCVDEIRRLCDDATRSLCANAKPVLVAVGD